MTEGVDGLLHDKSRPPGIAPLDGELVERVVALTLDRPQRRPRIGLFVRWQRLLALQPLRS